MNLRSIPRPSPARSQGSACRILGQEGRLQGREGSAFRPKVIDGVVHVAGRAAEPIQLDGNQFVGERRVPALPLRSGTSRRVAPRADGWTFAHASAREWEAHGKPRVGRNSPAGGTRSRRGCPWNAPGKEQGAQVFSSKCRATIAASRGGRHFYDAESAKIRRSDSYKRG